MAETHVVFACDESGFKGYADQGETVPGEVGVFAGVLIPTDIEAKAFPEFGAIYDKYRPATGKLHITDLHNNQKESLRQDIWGAIRKLDLPCFWYAIHSAGLHDWYLEQKKQKEEIRSTIAAYHLAQGTSPRVKRGSPRDNPASMHEELFAGLYAHLIAFLEERQRKELFIEVRSDQIDSPIVKNFEALAKRLLSDDPLLKSVKGWDTTSNSVVEGRIEINVALPPNMQIEAVVRKLTINTVQDDGYVLAADVLANSIHHLFMQRNAAQLYKPLNTPEAILGHPIAHHLAAFYNWGEGDLVGDRLYSHPKGRPTPSPSNTAERGN